jgi:cystathionine beta-lyase
MTITRATVPVAHTGTILRINVGLEDESDLWADLEPIVDAVGLAPAAAKSA